MTDEVGKNLLMSVLDISERTKRPRLRRLVGCLGGICHIMEKSLLLGSVRLRRDAFGRGGGMSAFFTGWPTTSSGAILVHGCHAGKYSLARTFIVVIWPPGFRSNGTSVAQTKGSLREMQFHIEYARAKVSVGTGGLGS